MLRPLISTPEAPILNGPSGPDGLRGLDEKPEIRTEMAARVDGRPATEDPLKVSSMAYRSLVNASTSRS